VAASLAALDQHRWADFQTEPSDRR